MTALVHYGPEQWWYPSGRVAAGVRVTVVTMPAEQLAALYDVDSLPMANPVMTDAEGELEFWAPAGDYALRANGVSIPLVLEGGALDTDAVKTYVHSQPTPSQTWVVTHNLNTYPEVLVKATDGTELEGDTDYSAGPNQVTISFPGGAVSGVAYLRG